MMMSGKGIWPAPPTGGAGYEAETLLDPLKNNCAGEWYGPHLVDEILTQWNMTKTIRDAQRVVVEKVDEPGKFRGFKPLHRHQKKYRNKQRNRITKLREFAQRARYLLTLTVDPKRFADDRAAVVGLRDTWRKIYYRLRRSSSQLQGLVVIEAQKNGQPHLHALLWGVRLPRGWAAQMYREVGSGYIHVAPVRGGNAAAASYLGKYLTKASDLTLGALTRWSTQTLTVCGKEMREHLGPLVYEKPTGDWVLFDFYHCREEVVWSLGEEYAEEFYYEPTGPPKTDI